MNSSTDTVTVLAETTIHFYTDNNPVDYKELSGSYDHKIVNFKIAPEMSIECGRAIAGIHDEMPFTMLRIFSDKDSIVAESEEKILDLFKKSFWGNLKTPYVLRIK